MSERKPKPRKKAKPDPVVLFDAAVDEELWDEPSEEEIVDLPRIRPSISALLEELLGEVKSGETVGLGRLLKFKKDCGF